MSVLHAAARLIYSKRKYEHITPLLMELHWLSVPERIQFKLAVLVGGAENAGQDIAGQDNDGQTSRTRHCRTGQ